jgi:hypothetical protein
MKKLNKLQINSEKLMKNEELMTLRGGYGPCTCLCKRIIPYGYYGYLVSASGDCLTDCYYAFGWNSTGNCSF